jgi:hypothetical protein
MKTAGWLAMASAFLTLPLVYLTFRLEGMHDSYADAIQVIIQTFGTLLFLAIILYLKRFLNFVYNFRDTDRNIDLMVMASIVTGVLSMIKQHSFCKFVIRSLVVAI